MTAPTLVAEPLWLASVDLDVDMERVPACEGFVDRDRKVPCPKPAEYTVRLVHVRDGRTCDTALMCGAHLQEQVSAIRRIEAIPDHLPMCPTHLVPIDTKAVPL